MITMVLYNSYIYAKSLIYHRYIVFLPALQIWLVWQRRLWMPVLCFLHFFTNLIYPSLKIISRICPEFFHIQNLSGSNLSCPEFIQVDLSRICPEFFMSGICSDLSVQNLSRIFHVQNLSRMCPEIVQIYLSRICPKFLYWTTSGQILDKVQFWILDWC